ncbi:YIP1 family protein [Paenibacillus sp. Y412MC10]|uniref:YIP1 family protein n=1 Tax=Geobacillus sp. (strain Y412MC10) TaxID=481743 RepID=UPI0011A4F12A|nr:YIP1 family protein [Paenibacillus sp. Y412MC10]
MKPAKLKIIRLLWGLLAVCLVWVGYPAVASADYPYATNYRSDTDSLVWTQAAFAPEQVLGRDVFIPDPEDPHKQVLSPLAQPSDLFVDTQDVIYVADTGNNRIVVFKRDGTFDRVLPALPDKPLSSPQGLYVDGKGNIYVADTGNARIVMLGPDGKLLKEYTLPESRFIPEGYRFEPIKVAVDKRGYVYIVSRGSYNGLLQLEPDGDFVRFFAANKAPFTLLDSIKRKIYTKAMYEKQMSKLPPAINNVNIDERGFVYTVSFGEQLKSSQVKKLNYAGKDFLSSDNSDGTGNDTFGEIRFRAANQIPNLTDIAVDRLGNFSVIDSDSKVVSQYDTFGNLLFFWSGDASPNTTQLGIVKSPAAIDINSRNEIYILDNNANLIQKFRQTEFGALVYKANNLTIDGRYKEAEPVWREVLHLNAYYTPAVIGLAQAAYSRGDYPEAKKLYLQAGIQKGYSNAFWQIRLEWLQDRFGLFMNILISVIVLYILYRIAAKRYPAVSRLRPSRIQLTSRFIGQLRHTFYVLRHPVDGFYALRYEHKGSYLSACVVLALAYISYAVIRSYTSFSFNAEAIKALSATTVFLQFFLVWVGWVISNYLVSSIMRGEGRFKDVFIGSSYALTPFIVIGLPLTLISNGMSLSEESIYQFLHQGMYVWVFLLLIWKVMSIQNYTVGETAVNLLYTVGTMVIIGVLCFILFGLSTELRSFIYSIVQEVSVR